QPDAPPSYDSVMNNIPPPPLYPYLPPPAQTPPTYVPQNILQTPAPCLVQTMAPQRSAAGSLRSRRRCYGGSSAIVFILVMVGIAVWLGLRYRSPLWTPEKQPETDTCPASSVICDGRKDCSQGSDEAGCVRFGAANELQVMTSKSGSFLPVCTQGWNKNMADQTCQQLGFRQSYADGGLTTSSSSFQTVSNCGTPPVSSRIIGGSVAADGQWPWQTSLHFQGYHTCGGTLVAPDFIITAAHCFPKDTPSSLLPSNWRVYIGFVSQLNLPSPYYVKQIIVNDHYDETTKDNDIALLKLSTPASTIQPICLPVIGQTFTPGQRCWTTGFGVTTQGADSISDSLMEVPINLIDSTVCNRPSVYNNQITKNMLCAGDLGGGKDSCQGDSGGPLVCKAGNQWYLTGITSWGDGCGKQNRPGVYSNVGQLLMWIYGKMQQSRP
ncbi:hypothetical protein DNTS_024966, partial [Danionella cerebrum]